MSYDMTTTSKVFKIPLSSSIDNAELGPVVDAVAAFCVGADQAFCSPLLSKCGHKKSPALLEVPLNAGEFIRFNSEKFGATDQTLHGFLLTQLWRGGPGLDFTTCTTSMTSTPPMQTATKKGRPRKV
jgi:hypothetical protein